MSEGRPIIADEFNATAYTHKMTLIGPGRIPLGPGDCPVSDVAAVVVVTSRIRATVWDKHNLGCGVHERRFIDLNISHVRPALRTNKIHAAEPTATCSWNRSELGVFRHNVLGEWRLEASVPGTTDNESEDE